MGKHKATTAVFVIHIWHEWSLTERRWYGRIENLHTKQVLTFQDPAQILPFLAGAGAAAPASRSLPDDLRD